MEFLSDFLSWAWARHHNVLSWYIRPMFILPFIYFAYKRNWKGLVVTVIALFTSMFWFPTSNQPAGEKSTGEQRKAKLLRLFKDWHEPIRHLLDSTPSDLILQNEIHDIRPFASWSTGRVTLLGDAAHPTTPNMGQGAYMAIESAFVLSRSLKEDADHRSALKRYESERHERTAWITNTSWMIGKGGQVNDPPLCRVRNFLVKVTPKGAMQRNIHRAAGFDATKVMS